jgi:hypothetical protein
MAEHVKFRLNAAKVGVSMALMALIGGLAEKVGVASARPSAGDAHFVKATSSPTGGSSVRSVMHKLATNFETTQKLNQTFLKIKSANTEFLKVDSANANFLKIDTANTEFLKIDGANSEFLKIDSTAANSSELGGKAPSAFVQGKGDVVSGYQSVTSSNTIDNQLPLVSSPDGAVSVFVYDDTGSITLVVKNATGTDLPAVQETNGQAQARTLTASEPTSIVLGSSTSQSTIQIMPADSSGDVITLTVSVDYKIGASEDVVAQMLIGLL